VGADTLVWTEGMRARTRVEDLPSLLAALDRETAADDDDDDEKPSAAATAAANGETSETITRELLNELRGAKEELRMSRRVSASARERVPKTPPPPPPPPSSSTTPRRRRPWDPPRRRAPGTGEDKHGDVLSMLDACASARRDAATQTAVAWSELTTRAERDAAEREREARALVVALRRLVAEEETRASASRAHDAPWFLSSAREDDDDDGEEEDEGVVVLDDSERYRALVKEDEASRAKLASGDGGGGGGGATPLPTPARSRAHTPGGRILERASNAGVEGLLRVAREYITHADEALAESETKPRRRLPPPPPPPFPASRSERTPTPSRASYPGSTYSRTPSQSTTALSRRSYPAVSGRSTASGGRVVAPMTKTPTREEKKRLELERVVDASLETASRKLISAGISLPRVKIGGTLYEIDGRRVNLCVSGGRLRVRSGGGGVVDFLRWLGKRRAFAGAGDGDRGAREPPPPRWRG
jgi:hypothetical protein